MPPAPQDEIRRGGFRGRDEAPRFGRRRKPTTVEAAKRQGYIERPEDQPAGSLLGGLLATVPGFLVHGVGHYYMGEHTTAVGLLIAEVVGVAALIAGALLDGAVEGSGSLGPGRQWLLHTGIMLFSVSWLADIIGAFKGASPLPLDDNQYDRNRMGLSYRYTSDPLTPFAHYIVLWYELHLGRVYLRPMADLEVKLDNRRFWFDVGVRIWQPPTGGEHLVLGARLRREEARIYGYALRGYEAFAELRLDFGRLARDLRGLYFNHRAGVGQLGYQLSDDLERAPSVFSPTDFTDNYLHLSTGLELHVARKTRAALSYVQDPTAVLAPISPSFGLVEWGLQHRYDDSIDVSFTMTMGQGYVAWLGVIFR